MCRSVYMFSVNIKVLTSIVFCHRAVSVKKL